MRILVVEDDTLLADALTRCLNQAAYAVDLARDGATANEILTTHSYDLVVLDVGLPKMDGFDVLKVRGDRIVDVWVFSDVQKDQDAFWDAS